MAKNQLIYISLFLIFISCNQHKPTSFVYDRQQIINYLKTEFKIFPDHKEFDSLYLSELKNSNKSLHVDSLINSCLRISRNDDFQIDLIQYHPNFYYKDSIRKIGYSINLIRDNVTAKIYFDFIDWRYGYVASNFCSYSKVSISSENDIPKDQYENYARIRTDRMFANSEIYSSNAKIGVVNYLNEKFRFKRLQKAKLDILFSFYDKFHHTYLNNASVLTDYKDLIGYFSERIKNITSRYYTEDHLVYLKDQINLLIYRNINCDNKNTFQNIFAYDSRLFERMISISGDDQRFFEYKIEEKDYCFL